MKDYIVKIEFSDFPRTKKEMRRVINYLRKTALEFEKEKDLNIYNKNYKAKLMK